MLSIAAFNGCGFVLLSVMFECLACLSESLYPARRTKALSMVALTIIDNSPTTNRVIKVIHLLEGPEYSPQK